MKTLPTSALRRLLAAALATLVSLGAPAQEILPPLTGDWTIGRTSEWPDTCTLGLLPSETLGGWGVNLHRGCKKAFAWTDEVTAWRMAAPDDLVLADATRHGVIHFKRDETGDWVGTGPDQQDYVFTRHKPRVPAAPRKKR